MQAFFADVHARLRDRLTSARTIPSRVAWRAVHKRIEPSSLPRYSDQVDGQEGKGQVLY